MWPYVFVNVLLWYSMYFSLISFDCYVFFCFYFCEKVRLILRKKRIVKFCNTEKAAFRFTCSFLTVWIEHRSWVPFSLLYLISRMFRYFCIRQLAVYLSYKIYYANGEGSDPTSICYLWSIFLHLFRAPCKNLANMKYFYVVY